MTLFWKLSALPVKMLKVNHPERCAYEHVDGEADHDGESDNVE
jgi:hypothetical protein